MTQPTIKLPTVTVNPLYAVGQIYKAQQTSAQHADAATRKRAQAKISQWQSILEQIQIGSVAYGSRTPLPNTPEWVSLDVAMGGFATGVLLAAGELQSHERQWLQALNLENHPEPRLALNQYFLSAPGLSLLQACLASGQYEITVPEEGALLVVAALLQHKQLKAAEQLITTLSPFFAKLRFYPKPLDIPRPLATQACVQTVGEVIANLSKIKPKPRLLAQQEAVSVWLPFYDRIVALMLETLQNGQPCQIYPTTWKQRAQSLLTEYRQLKAQHKLCLKHTDQTSYQYQLREFMRRCASAPAELTERELGRVRFILNSYIAKRGAPQSAQHLAARQEQLKTISQATLQQLARVVLERLGTQLTDRGLDNLEPILQAITPSEAEQHRIIAGLALPKAIQRKVQRCQIDSLTKLLETGLIGSGEVLAKVLPQITASLQAVSMTDARIRQLYAALYQAFRKRRSVLLLDLTRQVQLEELPWVKALHVFRANRLSEKELARQALVEVTSLNLSFFPYSLIPNKLLQELRALAKSAELEMPLVDELATDIFMGVFSEKFNEAVLLAGQVLEGSCYARYYGIDYAALTSQLAPPTIAPKPVKKFFKANPSHSKSLAAICAQRASMPLGSWRPALNGMIIEQQQILTSQNLAGLWLSLNLAQTLQASLSHLAQTCLLWVYKQQQIKHHDYHSQLIMLKNTAYAWRQMLFFLSLMPQAEQTNFIEFANAQFAQQTLPFRERFKPALVGLINVLNQKPLEESQGQRFLAWSNERHWLTVTA